MTRQEEIMHKHLGEIIDDRIFDVICDPVSGELFGGGMSGEIKILNAMDEHSKEVAMGFAEWKENKGYTCRTAHPDEYTWSIPLVHGTTKTTEQLFTQYIQSINKQ